MNPVLATRTVGARDLAKRARIGLAATMLIVLCGCVGAGVGVSYGGYYGPGPYDYDYDYAYGPWGPGYDVGPPVIVGGGFGRYGHGHDHDRGGPDGGGGRHYRPAAPSRGVPSIPSHGRPR